MDWTKSSTIKLFTTMKNEKSITALNYLIELHNDRIQGYENATNETWEVELKFLFLRFARTSIDCRSELVLEVTLLRGVPEGETQISAKFNRIWVNLKTALSNNNQTIMLRSLEQEEGVLLKAYTDILRDGMEYLNPAQQNLLQEQYLMLKLDHDAVEELCDKSLIEHG